MKVTFENATFQDSIQKAARVAPTKGEAFDKASGLLICLDPDEGTVTLKATNLFVFYLEVVDAVEVTGEGTWRLNSMLISQVASKLPIGSGKYVTLEQKGGEVHLKSGRTVAKFRTMDASYYPEWEAFDPDALEMVPDLGARISQVEWAAMTDHEVTYSGIHMDGENVMATDRIRAAMAPCEAEPIYKPITIPAGILKPVISNLRDVAVGIEDGMFLMMPDVSTQLRTRIYDKEYPKITQVFSQTWPNLAKFRKQEFLEIVERAVIFAQRDRSPKMKFIIGKNEIAVMCSDSEMGLLGDAIELNGYADHARHTILFTPRNLTDAVSAAPSNEIEIHYNTENVMQPIKIDGGSGYEAIVMPRKEIEPGE